MGAGIAMVVSPVSTCWSGTIQGRYANEKTTVPLPKWFLAIGLMVNAKKSLSSCQLARDLGLNTKTAWFMQQRIRAGLAANQASLLQGIVEADETYVGGKPRQENRREDDPGGGGAPCGRATRKTGVIGALQRGGKVVPYGQRLKWQRDLALLR